MNKIHHYRALENMYAAAPINQIFQPVMEVSEGRSEIHITVSEKFHHSAGGVHGSVYFKMLDDAAFFAANALEYTYFVLTKKFTTQFTRPIATGTMTAIGEIIEQNEHEFLAESVLYDANGREIGQGDGVFVCGRLPLVGAKGYLLGVS